MQPSRTIAGLSANWKLQNAFINGQFVSNNSNKFAVYNPSNGQVIEDIDDCNTNDAVTAIDSAQNSFNLWKYNVTGKERMKFLLLINNLLTKYQKDMAMVISLENVGCLVL